MANERIQQRIDPDLRRDAEMILQSQGIKPSQAIILFYTEITRIGGLPFTPTPLRPSEMPNAQLRKDLKEAASGQNVRSHTKKALFEELRNL